MVDRSIAPPVQSISKLELTPPDISETITGIPIYSFRYGINSTFRLEIVFECGKWDEPKGAVSFFTTKMMIEGSRKLSSSEISNQLDHFGAHIELSSGYDFITFSFYCLEHFIPKLSDLIEEIIFHPIFPDEALQIQKNIKLQNLKVDNEKSNVVASKSVKSQIFGNVHPYGSFMTEEDIGNIDRKDLADFFKNNIAKSKKRIFISGNIHPNNYSLLIKVLDKLNSGTKVEIKHKKKGGQKQVVQKWPNSVQSSLRLGLPTLKKNHKDFHKISILNEIFGGYFGSRLMQNLREEKGYTYGIYSQLIPFYHEAYLLISGEIKKNYRDEVVHEIGKEIKILKSSKIKSEELARVQNHLKGAFLTNINTPFEFTDLFKSVNLYNLDLSFFTNYLLEIESISSKDISEIANKYLNEDEFYEALVG